MSDTLFDSSTPRYSLPLLFVGQSHKEGFVNEIASRIDALLFLAIEGEADFPPTTSTEGESWLVRATPSGEWVGHARHIASRQGGNWLFTAPAFGMRLFDKSKNQDMYFRQSKTAGLVNFNLDLWWFNPAQPDRSRHFCNTSALCLLADRFLCS